MCVCVVCVNTVVSSLGDASLLVMSTSKPVAEPQAVEAEGPDGGWGWILVGALFASITFAHGLIRCSGILFVEFVQYFEENALHVSWVFSTGAAVLQLSSEPVRVRCLYFLCIVAHANGKAL